ncbi:hypothetical protein M422DRAFT_26687 [Sphaerobolus stellatus SS14]|nr:hypothetical protein M422DRAFT_26687 [Sphaerobolus stellatus SS14]
MDMCIHPQCIGPLSPFKDSTLPRPESSNTSSSFHSTSTFNTSRRSTLDHSESSDSVLHERFLPRSQFKPESGGWQASDWYGGTRMPRPVDISVTPEKLRQVEPESLFDQCPEEDISGRSFKIKVKVSLDLRQMDPQKISSSRELAEEIAGLYS